MDVDVHALPAGPFSVVLADPPWRYDSPMGAISLPYESLSTTQIIDMKPHVADDAILFLWTTATHMADAMHVLHEWGFRFKRVAFVWVKNRTLPGFYTNSQCEFVLLGTRGRPTKVVRPFSGESQLVGDDVIRADITKHSEKPAAVHERIEAMCLSHTSKLEMYARKQREGWVCWGNEL